MFRDQIKNKPSFVQGHENILGYEKEVKDGARLQLRCPETSLPRYL